MNTMNDKADSPDYEPENDYSFEEDMLSLAFGNTGLGEFWGDNVNSGATVNWHLGWQFDGAYPPNLITIGAEVMELYPALVTIVENHAYGVNDDKSALMVAAALLRRMTPEIELLAALPDALHTAEVAKAVDRLHDGR